MTVIVKSKTALLVGMCLCGLAVALVAHAPKLQAEEAARAKSAEAPDDKSWQAVAPGRVEPWSGEIKVGAPVIGKIGEVMVKVNDKVFVGQPLIRIDDDEALARLATMEAQVAVRKRARNDQSPSARAADRRKAEDAVADAERAVTAARAALDKAAAVRRDGGTDAPLTATRTALSRANDRLRQEKASLRRVENDSNVPLPSAVEGQLNIARAELLAAEAGIDKLTIRAPIDSTVLQVNARSGELASPNAQQPLLVLGDISALRVRAELDERDFGEIKIGQPVLVRAAGFRGREFAGKVALIAPYIDSGRINARGQRNLTDVNVAEVLIDLTEPGPLAVGMKVDVYFRFDGPQR